jgi:hypothetical protein
MFFLNAVKLYSYDDILLKTYFEIVKTQNLSLLIIKGKPTESTLAERWEQILKENSQYTGTFAYDSHFQKVQAYTRLLGQYHLCRAMLTKLLIRFDQKTVDSLKRYRIKIDTNSQEEFNKSLIKAGNQVRNMITKITVKQNELQEQSEKPRKNITLESVLAQLSSQLGYEVRQDLTLARYNEYVKIIEKRNERNQETRHNKR